MTRRTMLGTMAAAPAAMKADRGEISLAAWSLVKSYAVSRRWSNLDLPRITREEFGLGALEFVNLFFENPTLAYLRRLKENAARYNVKLVRIMVDDEGNMAAVDRAERIRAAVAHRRWVDAAHYLGCIDIRANLRGGPREWKTDKDLVKRGAESFRHLLDYARGSGIGVIIETHGGASSDPDTLVAVMKEVNDPAFGVLLDLININREVDYEQGLRKLLPWSKGISVHPVWTGEGSYPGFDMDLALRVTKESGFRGYWGIESAFGARMNVMARFEPGRTTPLPMPAGMSEEQVWQEDLKGVRLAKAILEKQVFG